MSSFLINTVVKSFKVLELLSLENELGVSEVSERMNCERSMGHRILATLAEIGYLSQNPLNRKYSISSKLFELGNRFLNIRDKQLVEIAHPIMKSLAKKSGETVNLGVLERNEVVCIDKILSMRPLKMDQPIGGKAGAHSTAFGKAILAFLPRERVLKIFGKPPLKKYTVKTLTGYQAILNELKSTRNRGYGIDDEEFYRGVRCVGAPIFNREGNVIAGLSISGPTVRMKKEHFRRLGKLVVEATKSISEKLGWSSPAKP